MLATRGRRSKRQAYEGGQLLWPIGYRPLMSEDRLVGASGCRSSRAFQGAAGRRSSGSSESATSRGEETSAVEGSCAQLWPLCCHFNPFWHMRHERMSEERRACSGPAGAPLPP